MATINKSMSRKQKKPKTEFYETSVHVTDYYIIYLEY